MKTLILAGDKQNYFLYKKLISQKYPVDIWGFNLLGIKGKKSLDIGSYDLIITSIPFSLDNITVHSPFSERSIDIEDTIKRLKSRSRIIGGPFNINDERFYDITKNKMFLEKSIIPMSEEVIKIVIEKSDISIYESSIVVIGDNMLSNRIIKLLKVMGSRVNRDDKSEIIINCDPDLTKLKNIYSKDNKTPLIIDISKNDERVNKSVVKARGLALKSAPRSMAKYLYETLIAEEIIKL